MGTNYIAPTWRQPKNANKDRLSDYSIQWQDGNLGNIISFQADADSSTNPFLPSTTNSKMSLSAFFNLQGGSGERIIISEKVSGSATHWKLSINTNDQLEFVARTDAGLPYYTTITGGTTISDNSWHHVALAWDGSNFNLYLDGVSDATPVAASTFYYNAAYTSWGDIGGQRYNPNAISNRFSGQLSQICYFDYSLSTDQVTYLSNMNNPMTISGAEPVAYWPLGDNSNPTANAGYPNIVSSADSVFDFTTNGYITLPTVPELGMAGASNYTTNIWINRDSASQEGILGYNYANPNGSGWYLWANGTTLTAQLGYDGGTTAPYGAWKYTIPSADFIGSWHMVTMVFDGSQTGQDRLKVYYDGVEPSGGFYTDANLFPSVLPNGVNADENRNVYLGVLQTGTNPTAGLGPSYLFNGQMSNAEFWKDSLTSAEVLTLYNNGQPLDGGQPEADKLRAWYKLNQSAVLTPGQIAPSFSFSKVGSPDLSGGDCFVENVGGVWQLTSEDMNCDSTNLTEYVVLDSREILGAETSAVVRIDFRWLHIPSSSSTTGVALDVSIDGGAYTNLLNSFGSGSSSLYSPGGGSVFVPGEWPITYSSSAKLRLKIQTGNSNGCDAFVKTLRLTSAGGTILYDANFSDSANQGTGYPSGSTPVQPTSSVVSVDKWEIPDNRSAYPQSFNFDGVADYVELGSLVNLGTVHTISWWEKSDGLDREDFIANPSSSSQIYGPKPSVLFYKAANVSSYMLNGNAEPLNVNLNDDKWHNISIVRNGASLDFYVDGLPQVIGLNALVGTEVFEFNSIMHPTAVGRYSKGTISNLAVFTTNLSAANIITLYNNGTPQTSSSFSPTGWWKLNNTTTGIEDSAGSNNGTNNGATQIATNVLISNNGESDTLPTSALIPSDLQFESPYSNYSLDFDGINNHIDFTEVDLGLNSTISFWINPEVTLSSEIIIGSGGASSYLLYSQATLLYVKIGSYTDTFTHSMAANNWYNITIVRTGDSIEVFQNATSLGTQTGYGTANNTLFDSIGARANGNLPFEGKMDELVVWNSALTQAQITQVYNNGYPADLTSLSPSQWWRLGEDAYFVGNDITIPNQITGGQTGTGSGTQTAILVGDAPGSYANGSGTNLVVTDRIGDAPESTANSVSINMIPSNRISYPAGYTPTQVDNAFSMAFDGVDDYFSINSSGILDTFHANPFSVSFWFKTSTGGTMILTEKATSSSATNRAFYIYLSSGAILWYGATTSPSYTNGSYNDGNWHHVACVAESDTVARIYVDGVDDTNNIAKDRIGTGSNTAPIILGTTYNQSGFFLNGSMDEFAVFNYALSERQIKQDIYEGTTTGGKTADLNNISNLTAPVAWYRMGD